MPPFPDAACILRRFVRRGGLRRFPEGRCGQAAALLLLAALPALATAQRVQCQAGRQAAFEGQGTVYDVTVAGAEQIVEIVEWPSVDGLSIVKVEEGFESSVMIVNGRRVPPPYRIRARLSGEAPGVYRIPGPTLRVDGRTVQGNPVAFTVRAAAEQDLAAVEMDVSKRRLYAGERLVATVDVYLATLPPPAPGPDPLQYHGLGLFGRRPPPELQLPWFPAPPFGKRHFDANRWARGVLSESGFRFAGIGQATFAGATRDVERAAPSGRSLKYRRYRFETDLWAEEEGVFRLPPATVEGVLVEIVEAGGGEPRGREVDIFAKSAAIDVEVLPLPREGRPDGFTGAVGRFALSMEPPAPGRLHAGDALYLTVVLEGDGRLEGVSIDFARALGPEFQVEEPKILSSLEPGQDPPPGFPSREGRWRQFEVRARPLSESVREVPAIAVATFDPGSGGYRVLETPVWPVTVLPRAEAGAAIVDATGGGLRRAPESAELVMSAMAANADDLNRLRNHRLRPLPWIAGMALLIPVYGVVAFLTSRRRALLADPALVRRKGAMPRFRARWQRAVASAGQAREEAAVAAFDALRGLLADLSGRPESGVTSGEVLEWAAGALSGGDVRQAVEALAAEVEALKYGSEGLSAAEIRDLLGKIGPALARRDFGSPPRVAMWVAAWVALSSAPAAAQPLDEFQKAQASFAAGRFEEAATLFAALRSGEYENGYVLYNEGNAWLRAGCIGRAMAAYRRAAVYLPRDENLKRNLSYALSRREQALSAEPPTPFLARLFFPGSLLGPGGQALCAAALAVLAFGVAVLYLAFRIRALRTWALLAAGIAAFFAASFLYCDAKLEDRSRGAVAVESVPLLQWPDPEADKAVQEPLLDGTEVSVIQRREGWVKVRAGDRYDGWLPAGAVATW